MGEIDFLHQGKCPNCGKKKMVEYGDINDVSHDGCQIEWWCGDCDVVFLVGYKSGNVEIVS